MNPYPKFRAFTLIELLTVIAIIGILAAILIPTVGAVRGKAKQATCLSNLRQISFAITAYADDHRGTLPGPVFNAQLTGYVKQDASTKYRGNLSEYLYPYMGAPEPATAGVYVRAPLFICPSWADAMGSAADDLNNPKPRVCYVMNGQTSSKYFGYANSTLPVSMGAVPDPAKVIVLTDIDQQIYADPAQPATPVHSGRRNTLYLDGHVALQ